MSKFKFAFLIAQILGLVAFTAIQIQVLKNISVEAKTYQNEHF
jgi:hypothetical protein